MRYLYLISMVMLFLLSAGFAIHETNISLNTTGYDLYTGYDVIEQYSFLVVNSGPDDIMGINLSFPLFISVISQNPPPLWNALSAGGYVYFNTAVAGIESSGYFNITLKSTLAEDIEIRWNMSSRDTSSYQYNSSVISYLKTTPPSISFQSMNPLRVSVVDDDGVSNVRFRWENASYGNWTTMSYYNGFYNGILTGLSQGVYTIRISANDSFGNVAEATSTYVVDSSPPTITISSPQEIVYDSWELSLDFTVSDNYDALVYCTYRLDTYTVPLGYVFADQEYSQHIVLSGDGSHVIYMACYDSNNNSGQTDPIVFSAETTPEYEPPPQVYYPPETEGEEEQISVHSSLLSIILESGTNRTIYLQVSNNENNTVLVTVNSSVFIEPFVNIPSPLFEMEPNSIETIPINIVIPEDTIRGFYSGDISLHTEESIKDVPIMIEVSEDIQTLIYSAVNIIDDDILPGDSIDMRIKLFNLGESSIENATLEYIIRKTDSNKVLFNRTENREFTGLSESYEVSFQLPALSSGYYLLEVSVTSGNYTDSSLASFKISEASIMTIELFGMKLYQVIIIVFVLIISIVAILKTVIYSKNKFTEIRNTKKRLLQTVDNVPKKGSDSIFVGKLVESENKAYMTNNELTKHVLVSGGTGAGKTIAAMAIVEEALLKNTGVVVFDPTAQWTGFAKPNTDPATSSKLDEFGLEPRSFKIDITKIENSSEGFDIKIEPGMISVVVLDSLDSDELDIFIKNTIEGLFAKPWKESNDLKLLLVFDEVHRLLPRYGGKRRAIPFVEKAVRECRKWGIGVVMISQVLTDFKAAIRANIGTEIQMRSEFEGDIRRIKAKYGSEIARNLTKLSVGWGMVQNPEYNKGTPYFVKFRPTLHQPHSIPREQIVEVRNYKERLEKIENKLKTLDKQGIDTFTIKTELSLARGKLQNLQFSMLKAYVESIEEKIEQIK